MVSVAGFYRDINHLDDYKTGSSFLSGLNNEVGQEKMSVAKNKLNEILAKIPSAFEKYRKMHDEKN